MVAKDHTVRDDLREKNAAKVNVPRLLAKIRSECGKSPFRTLSEVVRLNRGPGKLQIEDYVNYRLFDDTLHDDATRARFIRDKLHWQVIAKRIDMQWWAATEDKWLLYSVLDHHGLPVPETLAVVDKSRREYGRTPVVRAAEDLEKLDGFPLFFKPVKGVGSSGAVLVRDISGSEVDMAGQTVPVSEFFDTVLGGEPYLVQDYVRNHPDLSGLTSHLATVRCYNFRDGDDLTVRWTLLKLVGGNNIADNYWRDGNMIADVDPSSGRLRRVATGAGFSLRTLDVHPVSGLSFSDARIPYWPEVMALNERCANLYSASDYSNTDIAITPDGPVVVEVNIGGAFSLPQYATGRGFLTDEVAAFFSIPLKR